jgi:hypothetical protein
MGHGSNAKCHIENRDRYDIWHLTRGPLAFGSRSTSRQIQLPYERVCIVFVNEFERAVPRAPAV